uniref:ATP-dependent zinc metalloprotease FtsH n=1 Tax=Alistipes sp. Marseille-P5061 TaxID=2048242 RepID=UPI0018F89DEC
MANVQNGNKRPNMNMPRPSWMWIYGIIAVMILGWYFLNGGSDAPLPSDWTAVEKMVEQGEVEKIQVVNREEAQVFLKKEAIEKYRNDAEQPLYRHMPEQGIQLIFTIGSVDSFREDLKEVEQRTGTEIPVVYETQRNNWTNILVNVLPWVLIIGVWIFLMRSMARGGGGAGGGIMNVGKAKAQVFDKDNAKRVTFKDVAGLAEAKVEIMEIVDFLKKADKYRELGAKIPKGALLVGPPGTGKTLLAKAVAGEANVPFLSISGSDFVEMFVGVGASRVRDLFEQAKQKAPCIVFIDEIDAIGRARGKNAGFSGNDERENTLNQLLTEMDGFQTNTGVIVLAATNRVDILDKALTRAGRFDRQIEVGLPDVNERKEIFDVHLRPLKLDPQLDRSFLARQTPGFSGADIANVCNEAALIAARHNKKFVTREDFLAAIDRIVGGLEKPNMPMTPEERRITAIHEAGHAVVMWSLPECDPVLKVTVVPRGRSLGATWSSPDEDRIHVTDEALEEQLAGLLGGRIAEEVNYHTLGVGALSDLERATKTAYAMVTYYGMSKKIGPLSYYDSTGTRDTFTKPFSEQTAHDIDIEVRRFVEEAYARARAIIEAKNAQINAIADLLLEKETIYSEDLEQILGPAAQQPRNTAAKGGDAAKGDAADTRPADGTAVASDTEQADASDAKNGAPAASGATEPDEPKRENTPEPTSEH